MDQASSESSQMGNTTSIHGIRGALDCDVDAQGYHLRVPLY